MKKSILSLITLLTLTLSLAVAAQASLITLSDNTSETKATGALSDNEVWRAQAFTTTATAYTLTDVALWLYKAPDTTGTFALQIYDATGRGGHPGSFVQTVQTIDASTITGTSAAESLLYDYPNLDVVLFPNTKYYLVNKGLTLSSEGYVRWSFTYSSSGTGFPSDYSYFNNGSWVGPTQPFFEEMRIIASGPSAVPEPSTYALLCISLGVVGYARKRMNKG